jgi:ubiquinone/menaquinone biosynthesis C-methylase UbiE
MKRRYTGPVALLFALLFTWNGTLAQQSCVESYLKNKRSIAKHLANYGPIYSFQPGDVIASVGAGNGTKTILCSMLADSLTIYLEDIDPHCLSPETIAESVSYLYRRVKRTNTATFIPVIGTKTATMLPIASIDKLLIENSLHEFTQPVQMLADARDCLKPDGYLYVMELMSKKSGVLHQGCRKELFTHGSLLALANMSGLNCVTMALIDPNYPDTWVYTFQRK